MQDTIILGNGTSKQIKTASLPNSYAEFKAMAENGNLFADIKLNADGCEIVGTPLNKLNLLTDETAEKIGNPENIDEALSNAFDIVKNLPIVLESEIIFEGGGVGNFTKSLENFDLFTMISMTHDTATTDNIHSVKAFKALLDYNTEHYTNHAYVEEYVQWDGSSDSQGYRVHLDMTKLVRNDSSNLKVFGHKIITS